MGRRASSGAEHRQRRASSPCLSQVSMPRGERIMKYKPSFCVCVCRRLIHQPLYKITYKKRGVITRVGLSITPTLKIMIKSCILIGRIIIYYIYEALKSDLSNILTVNVNCIWYPTSSPELLSVDAMYIIQ